MTRMQRVIRKSLSHVPATETDRLPRVFAARKRWWV